MKTCKFEIELELTKDVEQDVIDCIAEDIQECLVPIIADIIGSEMIKSVSCWELLS